MLKRCITAILIILVFCSSLLLSLPGWRQTSDSTLHAVNGRLDLAGWDIDNTPILPLEGDWEFYWDQLLTPRDFSSENTNKPQMTGYMRVPGLWNGQRLAGEKLPVFGCATYRLVLENLPYGGTLGFRKGNVRFSSKVYVNGQELFSDGVPARQEAEYHSGNTPQLGFFSVEKGKAEILIQAANYEYMNSGIPVSLTLGDEAAMLRQYQRNYTLSQMVMAVLFTVAFLYLLFFLVARFNGIREYIMPLFSLFCILFALGNGLSDQRPLLLIMNIPFTLAFKLKDIFLTANFIVLLWILHLYKKGLLPLWLIRSVSILYSLYLISIFLLPIYAYIKIHLLVMVCNSILLVILLISSLLLFLCRAEGFLIFVAILSVNLYSADAILFSLGVKESSGYVQVYILIFAVVMMFLLSMQYFTAIRRLRDSMKRTQEAEISFLRAQINPHFLYNGLNSIAALCATAPEKAEDVTVALSEFLRRSFDFKKMDAMSTLSKELELLETYLYIEKTRFGDRLQVEYDLAEELELLIPPLILQPLVENAVRHGLMDNIAGGLVTISIQRQGDEAVFTITDNGVGMDTERLEEILKEQPSAGGIAVWNINQRLKLLYGRELMINSHMGQGTRVSFRLPLKEGKHRRFSRAKGGIRP